MVPLSHTAQMDIRIIRRDMIWTRQAYVTQAQLERHSFDVSRIRSLEEQEALRHLGRGVYVLGAAAKTDALPEMAYM